MRQWMEWELATWRDCFESMSEPGRGYVSDDYESCWWLIGCAPEYEHMHRVGCELWKRFPAEPRVRAWFQFIHPRMGKPSQGRSIPDHGSHPQWAFLAKECYQRTRHFADWWSRAPGRPERRAGQLLRRRHRPGAGLARHRHDLGSGRSVGADCAPGGRRRVERVKLDDGRPLHINGLNTRFKDGCHAYEEGIQRPAAGRRCWTMATRCCRTIDGHRSPATTAIFFRGNGTVFAPLREAGGHGPQRPPTESRMTAPRSCFATRGWPWSGTTATRRPLRSSLRRRTGSSHGGSPGAIGHGVRGEILLLACTLNTAKAEYLKPLQPEWGRPACVSTPAVLRPAAGRCGTGATLQSLEADRKTRYDDLGTTSLGSPTGATEKGYLEWLITARQEGTWSTR